ncbi:MAG: hypothetical protein ABSB19_09370 [Methylomonas sp.]
MPPSLYRPYRAPSNPIPNGSDFVLNTEAFGTICCAPAECAHSAGWRANGCRYPSS